MKKNTKKMRCSRGVLCLFAVCSASLVACHSKPAPVKERSLLSENTLVVGESDASLLEAGVREGAERTQAVQQEKIASLEQSLSQFSAESGNLSAREEAKVQLLSEAVQREIDLRRRSLAVHKAKHGGFGRYQSEAGTDATGVIPKRLRPSYVDAAESEQRVELELLREVHGNLNARMSSLDGAERESMTLVVEAIEREIKDREIFLQKSVVETY